MRVAEGGDLPLGCRRDYNPHMSRKCAGRCLAVLMVVAGLAGAFPVWTAGERGRAFERTQVRSLPDAPGVWKPWKPLTVGASLRQEQAATPALVKAFETELIALQAILRRAPGVASPVGFSVETWGYLHGYHISEHAPGQPVVGGLPLSGGLTFAAFPIFEYERNGKMIREDTGETAQQQFLVNQIGPAFADAGNVGDWGPVDRDAFLKPLPHGAIAGLPRYGDALIVARDPEALWTPLTLRAALDLVGKARELEIEASEESVKAYTERLAIVRDPAWREKRLAEARQAAASMPDPPAFVKQIEQTLVIEEASLVKELSPTTGTGRRLLDARGALKEVTDWIAELTPQQQAAGSCYAAKGATLRARFQAAPALGCHPLVRPNYGYYNKTLPRSAPQVVMIGPITRCFDTANKYSREANSPSPAGCRANRALIESLDKASVRAWLR